jgi:hypothetical protein
LKEYLKEDFEKRFMVTFVAPKSETGAGRLLSYALTIASI